MPATALDVVDAKVPSFIQRIISGAPIMFQSPYVYRKCSGDTKRQNVCLRNAEILGGGGR